MINIREDRHISLVMCVACRKYEDKKKMVTCSLCEGRYHQICVPKSHKDNFDSDDECNFVCLRCYKLDDDSDDSADSAKDLYSEYCYNSKNLYKTAISYFVKSSYSIF